MTRSAVRKAAGLCPRCSGRPEDGRVHCLRCLQYAKDHDRRMRLTGRRRVPILAPCNDEAPREAFANPCRRERCFDWLHEAHEGQLL